MKKYAILLLLFSVLFLLFPREGIRGQGLQAVYWDFSVVTLEPGNVKLVITANLDKGWHIYSQFMEDGGPMPTRFTFLLHPDYEVMGKMEEESIPEKFFDKNLLMDIIWYSDRVVFSQHIRLNTPRASIKGNIAFMICNSRMCLPVEEFKFSVVAGS